jgi:hypothetical protein
VYRGYDLSLQLLIDIKTAGGPAYTELSAHLERYRSILSSATDGRVRPQAVTAVISGDRGARAPMEAQHRRLAFYDGRLDDLGTGVPASFIPLISANWTLSFTWQGVGAFPADERAKLRQIVTTAHTNGQRVRFWATTDLPGEARAAVWHELLAAGVDYINTDDLAGLETFLRTYEA